MNLQTHKIKWIFDAAAEHFQESIEELELEILRHERFLADPIAQARPGPATNRLERIEACERWIKEYRDILAVCRKAQDELVNKSADEAAKDFVEFLKTRDL